MTKKDIVEMYKKGYSIKFISDSWYKYKNRDCEKAHYFGNSFIIPRDKYSRVDCLNEVARVICLYNAEENRKFRHIV